MVSFTLMQVLEDHWAQLSSGVVEQIRSDSAMKHMASLPQGELDRRARDVMRYFDDWLRGNGSVAQKFEETARSRFEQGVPLHEIIRALQLMKHKMISFVREQGADSAVKIFAEEELEYTIDRYFDTAIYHTVRGYEAALHFHAMRISAAGR